MNIRWASLALAVVLLSASGLSGQEVKAVEPFRRIHLREYVRSFTFDKEWRCGYVAEYPRLTKWDMRTGELVATFDSLDKHRFNVLLTFMPSDNSLMAPLGTTTGEFYDAKTLELLKAIDLKVSG